MLTQSSHSHIVLEKLLAGQTFQQIGDEWGVTRQRIHQLLTSQDRATWKEYRQNCSKLRRIHRDAALLKRRSRMWKNKPADRFWENVDQTGDCWEWKLAGYPSGYGNLYWGRRKTYVHRIAWELTNGPIPDGLEVCHTCDNPPCCNPDHLFLGTHQENIQDSVEKGRWAQAHRAQWKLALTPRQVEEIRSQYKPYVITRVQLARRYNVSIGTVNNVICRLGAYA